MKTTTTRFTRLTSTYYVSDDYVYGIRKSDQGWTVDEHGVAKNRLATLNDAKAWLRESPRLRVSLTRP